VNERKAQFVWELKEYWTFSQTVSGLRVLLNESNFVLGVSACKICPR
jgi:hypothetical protein